MSDILTPEQIADIREMWAGPEWKAPERTATVAGADVGPLCDSHEALRSSLAALTEERDRLKGERDQWQSLAITPKGSDHFIKRAEQAEAERDRYRTALEQVVTTYVALNAAEVNVFGGPMLMGGRCASERNALNCVLEDAVAVFTGKRVPTGTATVAIHLASQEATQP